jgi:hypothetical protein
MIRDDLDGLIPEVGIIDAEVSIKPLNFVRDELSGDKPLQGHRKGEKNIERPRWDIRNREVRTFAATLS